MIVCPTSAAEVVAPRYRRPLSTQPPPTPVPIVNMTSEETVIWPSSNASASAAQPASFST